jgi:hypothetical protein
MLVNFKPDGRVLKAANRPLQTATAGKAGRLQLIQQGPYESTNFVAVCWISQGSPRKRVVLAIVLRISPRQPPQLVSCRHPLLPCLGPHVEAERHLECRLPGTAAGNSDGPPFGLRNADTEGSLGQEG